MCPELAQEGSKCIQSQESLLERAYESLTLPFSFPGVFSAQQQQQHRQYSCPKPWMGPRFAQFTAFNL